MARSKSTSGSKANSSNTSTGKDQPNNSNLLEVKAVVAGTTPAEVAAAEVKKAAEPRKMEVVKSEPRKNAAPPIPINLEDEIRRRAYELYQQRGTASGSEAEDWLTAEREVKQRYLQRQSA
jgi:hypothetical protein